MSKVKSFTNPKCETCAPSCHGSLTAWVMSQAREIYICCNPRNNFFQALKETQPSLYSSTVCDLFCFCKFPFIFMDVIRTKMLTEASNRSKLDQRAWLCRLGWLCTAGKILCRHWPPMLWYEEVYQHMPAHTHTHAPTRMHALTHTHMHLFTHTRALVHTHTRTRTCSLPIFCPDFLHNDTERATFSTRLQRDVLVLF